MGAYGLVWSGLKKLLVRDGRAGRQDFVLKGLLPLWLALFALLSGTAFPVLGELGLVLIIAVDHLLDMGRSATNVVGNAVASALVAKWENELLPSRPLTDRPLTDRPRTQE